MDFEWNAPPVEDFDALLDDEDELQYIREMEMVQKTKKLSDVENYMENASQVLHTRPINDDLEHVAKRTKRSNSICKEIHLSPSSSPCKDEVPRK